jgi:CcmD family protein
VSNAPNLGYLFAAFAVVWVVLFGYVIVLLNRQKKLRREIDALKEDTKDKSKGKAK